MSTFPGWLKPVGAEVDAVLTVAESAKKADRTRRDPKARRAVLASHFPPASDFLSFPVVSFRK